MRTGAHGRWLSSALLVAFSALMPAARAAVAHDRYAVRMSMSRPISARPAWIPQVPFPRALVAAHSLLGITPGPDGNLWFTEYDGNSVGRLTPRGVSTLFA